jgi:Flp pilus assembly protein TadD
MSEKKTTAPAKSAAASPDETATGARPEPAKKPVAASDRSPLEACQSALRWERVKDALAACQQLAVENPKSVDALVLMAHADLLAGRDGETLRLARRASALDPKCADAYLLIGNVQQAAGRAPDARVAYEAYLRAAPRGAHAAEVRAVLKSL